MAITDKNMQAKATEKDQWFADDWGRGEGRFVGRITPSGKRAFYFRHTLSDGKRDTLLIGSYDEDGKNGYTLKEARAKALEWSKLYQGGARDLRQHFQHLEDEKRAEAAQALHDAEAEKRRKDEQERQADLEQQRRVTVRQLFDRWAAVELKPHTRGDGKRAGRKDGGQYTLEQFERRLFPRLGHVPVEEVKKADLLEILDAVKVEGRLRTGNMLLADMKQMFAFALNRDLIARNPLDTVTKRMVGGGDVERERILSAEELQTLVELLPDAGLNKRTEIALWLILATGCRIGELMGAAWSNPKADVDALKATAEAEAVKLGFVNLAARTWHITETKNQRDHTIHLSDFAVDKFFQLRAIRGAADWCFPNSLESGPVCVKSFGKQLSDRQRPAERRMKNRTSKTESLILPGGRWTAHDLRRTVASLMAVLGFSGDTIDECLNHKIESRVRRVYVRDRRLQDQARAFDALGARLAGIESGKASDDNVIAFKVA